jgi:hypothetical protein
MTLFAGIIFEDTANVNNSAPFGGSPHLTAVESPHFVAAGMTVLGNVALEVSITPKPLGFVVGTKFSDWAEHGFLNGDEESRVSQPIGASVKVEQ